MRPTSKGVGFCLGIWLLKTNIKLKVFLSGKEL
jgi:hypothetical protein